MPGPDDDSRDAPSTPLPAMAAEPHDDPALVHAARSLRAVADDERRSAAYAQSAPVARDDDDADSGGPGEERGTGAATGRERTAEHHESVAARFDQARGDVSTSRRR